MPSTLRMMIKIERLRDTVGRYRFMNGVGYALNFCSMIPCLRCFRMIYYRRPLYFRSLPRRELLIFFNLQILDRLIGMIKGSFIGCRIFDITTLNIFGFWTNFKPSISGPWPFYSPKRFCSIWGPSETLLY